MASRHGIAHDPFAHIRKRQNGCVQCLNATPKCPDDCTGTEACQITVPLNCMECPKAYCAAGTSTTTSSSSNNGPSGGAIAGAVIGGVAVIGIVTYLVWRFCIKNKRQTIYETGTPAPAWNKDLEPIEEEGQEKDFESRRSKRASTHTVHSIASTVLTRASNIIQIAYIPGVTNRATPTSPTLLVPPVPPIPLTLSDAGTPSSYEDQHFFVPGELRDSTYSGISSYSDRTSYATRTSYAPRSSVASTIYGKNAVVSPMPAQKGTLLKPSLVSVKSRGASSGSSTPPVPAVDYEKYEQPPPSPAFSIGATFFKNASASTATAVRPQVVRVGSGPKKATSNANSVTSSPSKSSAKDQTIVAEEEVDGPETPGPLISIDTPSPTKSAAPRDSNAATIIDDTPAVDQGPFSDPPTKPQHKKNNSLGAVIEEASRRAAQGANRGSSSSNREQSPFGDEHAVRE